MTPLTSALCPELSGLFSDHQPAAQASENAKIPIEFFATLILIAPYEKKRWGALAPHRRFRCYSVLDEPATFAVTKSQATIEVPLTRKT